MYSWPIGDSLHCIAFYVAEVDEYVTIIGDRAVGTAVYMYSDRLGGDWVMVWGVGDESHCGYILGFGVGMHCEVVICWDGHWWALFVCEWAGGIFGGYNWWAACVDRYLGGV